MAEGRRVLAEEGYRLGKGYWALPSIGDVRLGSRLRYSDGLKRVSAYMHERSLHGLFVALGAGGFGGSNPLASTIFLTV